MRFHMLIKNPKASLLRIALASGLFAVQLGCGGKPADSKEQAQAEQELQRLRETNQELKRLQADNQDLARLRKDNDEAQRLRTQTEKLPELRQENDQLRAQMQTLRPGKRP
jgi:hypothetical protein